MSQNPLPPGSEGPAPLNAEDLYGALRHWNDLNHQNPKLAALYIVRRQAHATRQLVHHAIHDIVKQGLAALEQTNAREVELLQLRFIDGQSVNKVARHFHVSVSRLHIMQNKALSYLATTLNHLEDNAWNDHQQILLARLEAPTTSEMIGIDEQITHLLPLLTSSAAPWIICLEGLGGIGKTSLADATVRHAITHHLFDEVGWVTARRQRLNVGGVIGINPTPALTAQTLIEALAQQLIPRRALREQDTADELLAALRRQLKALPHLIVIDNLETVTDLDALLPTLQELANPTKFLLTSREVLFDTPNLYHIHVPELSERDALTLIRQEIAVSNLQALADCQDDLLLPIVKVVGGNPLALRLVIGQAHIHALDQILAQLRTAKLQMGQDDPIENLYTYIYRQAWESLTAIEQDVLLVMPVVNPNGDELDFIAAVGDKPIEIVHRTLNHLVRLSLIDVLGTINDRRYRIHGLTRTFLQDEVLKW